MHEARAAAQDLDADHIAAAPYLPQQWDCGDQMLLDQARTGTLPLTTFRPCVDLHAEGVHRLRRSADQERAAARRDRARAAMLVRAATVACGGLPPRRPAGSIFARDGAVSHVVPLGSEDAPQGVAVVLVAPGLTAARVRREIACRRAQWAVLGNAPDLLRDDPTLVPGAQVTVTDIARGVEVEVTTPYADAARRAIARAERRPEPGRAMQAAR